ncbi:MAG TPA: acyltransferase [Burkholderiaceae bacterium]|nr:acyltransferase [Burkholderiaceae bacterium]
MLFSHGFALLGLREPSLFGRTLGSVAVCVFFSLSGYLICQSWERDPSTKRFLVRRLLRIMPGLVVAVIFCALVVGPLATGLPLDRYLSSPAVWSFVLDNISLLRPNSALPGVFQTQSIHAVNGSLWTLRYEALMYLLLMGFGMTGALRRWVPFLLAGAVLAATAFHWIDPAHVPLMWRVDLSAGKLAELSASFFAGATLYLFRGRIPLRWAPAVLLIPVMQLLPGTVLLALPYLTITAAQRLCLPMKNDVSYGVYIYAFPVQQLFSRYALAHGLGWLPVLLASTAVTFVLAVLSWILVEKPSLSLKQRGRASLKHACSSA